MRAAPLVLGLALVSAACKEKNDSPIVIGVVEPLTGPQASYGVSAKNGIDLAIEEQNAKGGLLGKKLKPVVVDPASDWPRFAELARELIAGQGVDVVFGCKTVVL